MAPMAGDSTQTVSAPLRVVQYHPRALVGDGGISNSVRSLSDAMSAAGALPRIVYADGEAPHPSGDVEWVAVPHVRLGPVDFPRRLRNALAGGDVLVLNSAWTAYNVRAGQVARAVGLPYVVAHRGAYDPLILQRRRQLKRAWWSAFEEHLVQGAAALHVFFESQQEPLRRLGFPGPFVVAPNGVRVPSNRKWDGGSGGYLLFLGRFDPEHKGLDLLVHAASLIPAARRPQVRLHGPDWKGGKARVAELVTVLGMDEWIHVGPALYADEKWATMTAARGFVYPSRWEGFGNAPAEAGALGVPVMTTPYPLGRHFEQGGAALVVAADPPAIAEGLEALDAGMPQLGKSAARLVQEEFSWEAVARAWLDQLAVVA